MSGGGQGGCGPTGWGRGGSGWGEGGLVTAGASHLQQNNNKIIPIIYNFLL